MKRLFLIIPILVVMFANTFAFAGNTTQDLKVVVVNCKTYPVTFYLTAKNGVFSVTLKPGQQSCFSNITFVSSPYENIFIYASSNQDNLNTNRFYVQWHNLAYPRYEIMPTGNGADHSTAGSMKEWYSVVYATNYINKPNYFSWKSFADINGDSLTASDSTVYNCSSNGTVCTITSGGELPNSSIPPNQQALFFAFGNTNMPDAATISWETGNVSPTVENTTSANKH